MSINRKTYFFIASFLTMVTIISIFSSNLLEAKHPSQLLLFACDGEQSLISIGKEMSKISEKMWIGDVPRGFLFEDHFWYIDGHKIMSTNLTSKESVSQADTQNVIDHKYIPWQIGYVDNKTIVFSALRYDKNLPINEQEKFSQIYGFDKIAKKIERIQLGECSSPYFSVFHEKVYFTNINGEIYEFNGSINKPLGIKGNFPSVSPNGKKIMFSSFGVMFNTVKIYEIETNKTSSLIKFAGPKGVNPILRWSCDNNLIAIKKRSDLKAGIVYIIDTKNQKILQKIQGGKACNWFFTTK